MSLNDKIYIFVLFLAISLFSLAIARSKKFFKIEDLPWGGKVASRDLFGAFLFFIGVHLVVAPLTIVYGFKVFFGSFNSVNATGWALIYSMYLACLTLFFFTAKLTDKETRESIWSTGTVSSSRAVYYGILSFFVGYPIVIAVGQLIRIIQQLAFNITEVDQVAVEALKLSLESPVMSALMAAGVIGLVPIAEELLFRGYLQGWMRRFLHAKLAIVLTSIIFAAFHFSTKQGWSNIEYLFSLFILSYILGLLYEKHRNLWAPIGLHVVFNTVNVVLLYRS